MSARNWSFLPIACVWVCSIQATDPGSSSSDESNVSGGDVLQCKVLGDLSENKVVNRRIHQCSNDELTGESASSKQGQFQVCYQFQVSHKSRVAINVDGLLSSVSLRAGTVSDESVLEEGSQIITNLVPLTYFIVGEVPRCITGETNPNAAYQVRIQLLLQSDANALTTKDADETEIDDFGWPDARNIGIAMVSSSVLFAGLLFGIAALIYWAATTAMHD